MTNKCDKWLHWFYEYHDDKPCQCGKFKNGEALRAHNRSVK